MMKIRADYERVLTFLEHQNSDIPIDLQQQIQDVMDEAFSLSELKFCHSTAQDDIFDETVILFAITLGATLEQRMRFYEKTDMAKATMLDAAANSILENALEQLRLTLKSEGYCIAQSFCPGNQGIPIEKNKEIFDKLDASRRIGVYVSDYYSLQPLKTMVGFFTIGLAEPNRIKCEACTLLCKYRKKKEQ